MILELVYFFEQVSRKILNSEYCLIRLRLVINR